jgi:phytoene dehydrogenase-like protein
VDTNFYDVVVCGGDLSGLVSAALLARRGHRVLLIGHEPDHPAFEAGGRVLSRAPALLPPLDGAAAGRVFKDLDCSAMIRRRAAPVRPAFRAVVPGQQQELAAGAADLETSVSRVFGSSGAPVARAIDRLAGVSRLLDPLLESAIALPPNGFWERREVGRLESLLAKASGDPFLPLAAEHPFRSIASAVAAAWVSLIPHEIGPVAEARAFDLARRGLSVFEGGLAKLHDLLLERFATFGGDQRERLTPIEILVRRGRVAGIRVRPGDETIGCHKLVWAGAAANLRVALGSPAPAPGTEHRRAHPLRVAGYRYGVACVAGAAALPEGTPTRILAIANPTRPLTEDNALAVTIDPPGDRNEGERAIWIECVVPSLQVDTGPSYLRALRVRLVHTLGRLIPDLGRHLKIVASPFDGLPPDLPGGKTAPISAPAPGAPARPPLPPRVFAQSAPRALDVLGSHQATGIKNLFLAGRENLPGLGLEGELVSGWGAARLIGGAESRRHLPHHRTLIGD